jgi:hypothetical protein
VASIIVAELDSLGLKYPQVSDQQRENLAAIGKQLEKRADGSHDSGAVVAVVKSRQPQLNGSS